MLENLLAESFLRGSHINSNDITEIGAPSLLGDLLRDEVNAGAKEGDFEQAAHFAAKAGGVLRGVAPKEGLPGGAIATQCKGAHIVYVV